MARVPALANASHSNDIGSSNPEMPVPSTSLKKEGKKRAIDEDDEATATDDDGPIPDKTAKKRKSQHK